MEHGNGALCEYASNDDGLPKRARPRLTQRNQDTCTTEQAANVTKSVTPVINQLDRYFMM